MKKVIGIMKNNLKLLRTEKHLYQKDIANLLNIAISTYSYWESGFNEPDQKSLIKLADFYNVSVDYLLGRTENKEKALGINQGQEELKNIPVALYEGVQGLSPEGMQDVMKYIEFVKAKEKGGK